jgi:hypothetical protein
MYLHLRLERRKRKWEKVTEPKANSTSSPPKLGATPCGANVN